MMVVFAPTVSEEGLPEAIERVSGYVTSQNGEVQSSLHENPWGRRRLAYQIDDHRDAFYVLYRFTSIASAITEIEREIKLDETVIRYLLVRYDEMTEHTERAPRERPGDGPGGPGGVPFRRTPATTASSEETSAPTSSAASDVTSDAGDETTSAPASAEQVEPIAPDAAAVEATTTGDTEASTETADPGSATEDEQS